MLIRILTYFLFLLLATGACTNARWMLKDDQIIDPADFLELSSRQFPVPAGTVTPEDPVLRLHLLSETSYEYSEKVLMARYMQDYSVRPFFLSLGLMGAGAAFYLANSNAVLGIDGRLERVTLNMIGGFMAVGSILNFEPSGDPRPTGEERFLRQTGSRIQTDTMQVTEAVSDSVVVDIQYGDRTALRDHRVDVSEGMIEIDLGTPLNALEIVDRDPDQVQVQVEYADSTYTFSYPLQSVLRPFARIEAPVTELRSAPEEGSDYVLAELVEGSQLQIVEETGDRWLKVLYGISENYISKSGVEQVWRRSDFAQKSRIFAVPTVPFGNVDVENNIPILVSSNPNGIALIAGNEEYSGDYAVRTYTGRDMHLVETYLTSALGYNEDKVLRLENFKSEESVDSVFTTLSEMATDSSEIVIYLSGYGFFQNEEEEYSPYFLPSSGDTDSAVNLINLFARIAELPSESTVILNNIDFRQSAGIISSPGITRSAGQLLYNASASVASQHPGLAILFSSEIEQRSHIYLGQEGEDKKHHIFPYFFAKALQQRNTTLQQIFQFLQRNVSYTSRKLHDQSQDPLIFGDQSIDLAE